MIFRKCKKVGKFLIVLVVSPQLWGQVSYLLVFFSCGYIFLQCSAAWNGGYDVDVPLNIVPPPHGFQVGFGKLFQVDFFFMLLLDYLKYVSLADNCSCCCRGLIRVGFKPCQQ